MRELRIGGDTYRLVKGCRAVPEIRESFEALTRKIYGFDFESWYQHGYWKQQYLPYLLMKESEVVANVSVNLMKFTMMGEPKRCVQIGTVMTHPLYRRRGLSRVLMEEALRDWEAECDWMFLFANDSVLDFYPKFGFHPVEEYQWYGEIRQQASEGQIQRMDFRNERHRRLLYGLVEKAKPYAKLNMEKNAELILFYALNFLSENFYYLPAISAVAVVDYAADKLLLQGIFCEGEVPLKKLAAMLAKPETKEVCLEFTPRDTAGFQVRPLHEEDCTLFMRPAQQALFRREKLRFPVLSHT